MIAKIEQLLKEVEALHASNAEELEALRIKYLSKKGAINDLMADFRNVAAEQKKEVGMRLNELKTKAQDKINALTAAITRKQEKRRIFFFIKIHFNNSKGRNYFYLWYFLWLKQNK